MSAITVLGMLSLTYKLDICWKESGYIRIRTASRTVCGQQGEVYSRFVHACL